VYVSCDAATLARDIGALRHEYRVIRVCSIEALPQTHHVEAMCVLELT
jgi:23S rRNA (uracil1939-C5)-methyltransferase